MISRTSTQQYQSKSGNLSEISKQLWVAHILEENVQKSTDSVRVNMQLIRATKRCSSWADTCKLTHIFSVESEVAKGIAEQLRAKFSGQREPVLTAKPTEQRRGLRHSGRA